ncbi:uroporphyrinogen-III C-methyltransferase, partial [Pectobacterium brasiliense]|nr:uroporphyrinogen-III C-methyltransferase [Pectobacterium brasiliense]
MTEHNTPTAPSDEVAERVEPAHQQQDRAPRHKRSGAVMFSFAIVFEMALGDCFYYKGQMHAHKETAALQLLEAEFNRLLLDNKQEQHQWLDAQLQHRKAQETGAQRLE